MCAMSRAPARHDPFEDALPGFDELLIAPVPGPMTALYRLAGSRIRSSSRIQATWRPGRRLTVRYRVVASAGSLAGSRDVVAVAGELPAGAIEIEGADGAVGLWVVPDDPHLPGLRSALDPPTVRRLLGDLGFPDEVVNCRLRAYRPGRRAVVEVKAERSSLFLKVVPPAEVLGLHERHRHLSGSVAVPDSLGLAANLGIVAMTALPGTDLRSVLRNGSQQMPGARALCAMIARLPEPHRDWMATSPIDSVRSVADLLVRLVPEERDRLNRIVSDIGVESDADRVPVHGDFHEAQILVDGQRPVGLIDVDTYGWGRRADDASTMLGHLHLLAPGCSDPSRVLDLARSLNRRWDASLDPVDLRMRTAAVVLGLATGPFRVQRPNWREETVARIEVAERWVESACVVDERSLIPASAGSHTDAGS